MLIAGSQQFLENRNPNFEILYSDELLTRLKLSTMHYSANVRNVST